MQEWQLIQMINCNLKILQLNKGDARLENRIVQINEMLEKFNGLGRVKISIKKPLLIQGIYRQFKRLGRKGSGSYKEQQKRWDRVLKNWELAQREKKEIITVGDCNINKFSWEKTVTEMNDYEKAQAPLVQNFKDKILNKVFFVLNNKPTQIQGNIDARPSCLDIAITNEKNRIINHDTIYDTFSDHAAVMVTRSTKMLHTQKQYIRIRSFKKFQTQKFKQNILEHWDYIPTLHEMETKSLAIMTQKIIKQALDDVAPVKIIQISKKNQNKLSENTRRILADRDMALENYKNEKTPENLREYKNFKNLANREIGKENYMNKVNRFKKSEQESTKKQWEVIKNVAGQKLKKKTQIIMERGGRIPPPGVLQAPLIASLYS